jgi:predicted nucleic acid-binding protein
METEIILCDTDTIIEVINNNTELIDFLDVLGIDNLIISSITRAELQQGARNIIHLSKMNCELNKLPVLDIDDTIAVALGGCLRNLFLVINVAYPIFLTPLLQ